MIAADTLITNVNDYTLTVCQQAREASAPLASSTTAERNNALMLIADKIDANKSVLMSENQKDLEAGRQAGLDNALIDRLELTADRISGMSEGLRQIASLPDPIGGIDGMSYRPSGIQVGKMRVPLGVIGIIYESRPNVTADAAGLCLKSGNACVLRGGSEAIHSNQAIAAIISDGLKEAGLPEHACQVLATTDRAAVGVLLTSSEYVDVIIPRGGKGLIKRVMEDAKVPVIKHLDGICHVYVDAGADLTQAMDIAFNSKTHRYGVCNAMETLLIHESMADKLLPGLVKKYEEKQVELRACGKTLALFPNMNAASEEDWDTEYLAPVLSIKIVSSLDDAISHINTHSSQHTDSIVTRDHQHAMRFVREVDSSSVMVNASTRFADGFEYGLGAEIGISTDKFHVRGPVGLEGLTSQKYVVLGDGHIR